MGLGVRYVSMVGGQLCYTLILHGLEPIRVNEEAWDLIASLWLGSTSSFVATRPTNTNIFFYFLLFSFIFIFIFFLGYRVVTDRHGSSPQGTY